VADINRPRDALGITGRMHVFGGSWGSTLALVYAIRHPEHVASLILRGIFLGTREDLLYMYQGNAAVFTKTPYALTEPGSYVTYPDEWKAFVEIIPPTERGDMMGAYKAIFDMARRRRRPSGPTSRGPGLVGLGGRDLEHDPEPTRIRASSARPTSPCASPRSRPTSSPTTCS
jgi:pimeloyl-ACP methyl ester carboxylesterase